MLGALISNRKFASASLRIRKYPDEAALWASAPSNGTVQKRRRSRRQSWPDYPHKCQTQNVGDNLPLHMACNFLATTKTAGMREKLENLIRDLKISNDLYSNKFSHPWNLGVTVQDTNTLQTRNLNKTYKYPSV